MLLPFRNLLRAEGPADIFRSLADAAVERMGADGVALVQVLATGEARVVEARKVPEGVREWNSDVETVDAELGERLLGLTGGRFAQVHTFPLMGGGSIYGALVLFFEEPITIDPGRLQLAEALADLAAIELGKAIQHEELARSHAELRASREAMARGEKLRALGEMAAGVSHDLRNILNPLSLHLQLLKRSLKKGHTADAEEAIAEMEQVLKRGVETIERLRDFSRQTPETRMEVVDVNAIAREAAEIGRSRLSSGTARGVRLLVEPGEPPAVLARAGEFVAALVNLIVNAIDATPEGGTVKVTTGADGEGACVKVSDTGPGIPEEIQRRIFEPFFTTKGKAGTGLGLPMVYAFVKRHGGTMTLDTGPDRGTTFTLRFPRVVG